MFKLAFKNCGYWFRYHRKSVILSILAVILMTILMTACAGFSSNVTPKSTSPNRYQDSGTLLGFAFSMIDEMAGVENFTEFTNMVDVEITDSYVKIGGATINSVGPVINSINQGLMMLGITLATVMFFVGIYNATIQQSAYDEILVKRILMLAASISLCYFSVNIVSGIINIGNGISDIVLNKATSFLNQSGDGANAVINIKNSMWDECNMQTDGGWLESLGITFTNNLNAIGYIIRLLIPYIFCYVCKVLVGMACWGRGLEAIVLIMFAPLAFCDISGGSGAGNGSITRFIKHVAAVALQGAVMVAIFFFCNMATISMLNTTGIDGFLSSLVSIIMINLAMVGACQRSLSICKEIIS